MTFRIGQKVVCVDDVPRAGFDGWHPDCDIPQKGSVYTVREIGLTVYGDPGLKLEEIRCCVRSSGNEHVDTFYFAQRFRPVVERKTETGMAILREILDRESHQDRVPEKVRR